MRLSLALSLPGLTPQVGFIRPAAFKTHNSGRPELRCRSSVYANEMDAWVKPTHAMERLSRADRKKFQEPGTAALKARVTWAHSPFHAYETHTLTQTCRRQVGQPNSAGPPFGLDRLTYI